MIIKKYLPFAALAIVLVLSDTEHENSLSDEQGTGRIFPLLPPYYGVDYAANFNKLKSSGDAAYFVVRDSMVVGVTATLALISLRQIIPKQKPKAADAGHDPLTDHKNNHQEQKFHIDSQINKTTIAKTGLRPLKAEKNHNSHHRNHIILLSTNHPESIKQSQS